MASDSVLRTVANPKVHKNAVFIYSIIYHLFQISSTLFYSWGKVEGKKSTKYCLSLSSLAFPSHLCPPISCPNR